MVRRIDGEHRRRVLAEAVWRLMRKGGLEAATVRGVAEQAGLSTGSVRYFFETQDELHIFALTELTRRVTERLEEALSGAPSSPVGDRGAWARSRVLTGLRTLLPLDDESTADFIVHLQFAAKAMVHAPLRDVARHSQQLMSDFYEQCVQFLVSNDHPIDAPSLEARKLGVLMDGLVVQRLTAPELLSADQMVKILRDHLEGLNAEAVPSC